MKASVIVLDFWQNPAVSFAFMNINLDSIVT
jgi:hypothetical protein